MSPIPKKQFFRYFRQRLENVKQLSTIQPGHEMNPAASFEPEQNILVGAEIDALAKYWALNGGRSSGSSAIRMAEFLAAHGDARIWNKCSHADLLDRAASLENDIQKRALERALGGLARPDATSDARMLSWQDDPDLATLTQHTQIQNAGIPEKFLADGRYGVILYRRYRCAWVHELNSDPRLRTDEPVPGDLPAEIMGEGPYYMARNQVRRLHMPTSFIVQSLERVINSFERLFPDGAVILT